MTCSSSSIIPLDSIPIKTNPNLNNYKMALCASPSLSSSLKLNTLIRPNNYKASIVVPRVTPRALAASLHRRTLLHRSVIALAASQEDSKHSDVEVEKEGNKIEAVVEVSQKAWNEALASFKEQALKTQNVSQEACELYVSKALVILKETSDKLKIQADKATQDLAVIAAETLEQLKIKAEKAKEDLSVITEETSEQLKTKAEKAKEDLSVIAQQVSEEGKVYISAAVENSPESIKDIVGSFVYSFDGLSKLSEVQDFHIGIPYGLGLSIGGFLSFMFTGSISSIRFGVILGGALLALSISSLQAWRKGDSVPVALKGQSVIASVIFLRELRVMAQRPSFSGYFATLLSGAMLALYLYRFVYIGKKTDLEPGTEN